FIVPDRHADERWDRAMCGALVTRASSRTRRSRDVFRTGVGMNASQALQLQGHRLLQIGVALFLFTSLDGFALPYFAVPLLGRSVHQLSALLGLIFIALGLSWPRFDLGAAASRLAFWFLIYSGFAITAAFIIAGITGAGKSTMPLAGAPMGTPFQELVIEAV